VYRALRDLGRRHPIGRLVASRVIFGVAMLWLVSVLIFFFTQALPGDIVRTILGQSATPEQIRLLRRQLGLDQSVPLQYWHWLSNLVQGRLGTSLANGLSVSSVVGPRIVNSLTLVGLTACIAFPLAFFLGVTAAHHRGGVIDSLISSGILVLLALPEFIIAVLVVIVLATSIFHVLPPVSALDPAMRPWQQPNLLVLPVIALVLGSLPYLTQMVRGTMAEILSNEYVTWARLNGVPERRVVWRHALRNALPPSVQVATITLIFLVGGIVAVETVFSYPGLGLEFVNAVATRDIPVVQAIAMFLAAITFVLYLVADVIAILLTPRLRTQL
jgi:peptide/nickel transport system permease protein